MFLPGFGGGFDPKALRGILEAGKSAGGKYSKPGAPSSGGEAPSLGEQPVDPSVTGAQPVYGGGSGGMLGGFGSLLSSPVFLIGVAVAVYFLFIKKG